MQAIKKNIKNWLLTTNPIQILLITGKLLASSDDQRFSLQLFLWIWIFIYGEKRNRTRIISNRMNYLFLYLNHSSRVFLNILGTIHTWLYDKKGSLMIMYQIKRKCAKKRPEIKNFAWNMNFFSGWIPDNPNFGYIFDFWDKFRTIQIPDIIFRTD